MKTLPSITSLTTCIMLIIPSFLPIYEKENILQSTGAPKWLVVEGLVANPLNISYIGLRNFPQISEVATLQCIGGGQGSIRVTYNWTGVPLFYLLSMAKVIPGAYREVVFKATDEFSSSIRLETAMEPTTILALKANGTDLEEITYFFGRGYRIVLPCMWGYKWVKWVNRIIVVDYDYKGTYEQMGYSDEAIRPNCVMPATNPSFQNFTAIKLIEHVIQALSNFSIESFKFNGYRRLVFNVAGPTGTSGYFYITFMKNLLACPFKVFLNQSQVAFDQTETGDRIYLFFTYACNTCTIEIEGNPGVTIGGGRKLLK